MKTRRNNKQICKKNKKTIRSMEPLKHCKRKNFGIAVLDMGNVNGVVRFSKKLDGVKINYKIHGLKDGMHGFHIHEYGDMSQGCATACSHFNPYNKKHGGLHSKETHLGDLGNIIARNGVAKGEKFKKGLSLDMCNPACIIGRMIIIHKERDDLGPGSNEESLKTGNAGPRLACGVIGLTQNTTRQ
tara:strand:- start:111 stop:668 length:558 start_codon:yes stop_codon:yes gene_type:complete